VVVVAGSGLARYTEIALPLDKIGKRGITPPMYLCCFLARLLTEPQKPSFPSSNHRLLNPPTIPSIPTYITAVARI